MPVRLRPGFLTFVGHPFAGSYVSWLSLYGESLLFFKVTYMVIVLSQWLFDETPFWFGVETRFACWHPFLPSKLSCIAKKVQAYLISCHIYYTKMCFSRKMSEIPR
uniref:Uncharacterized protein n=1 Tax=Opuntia streptacantha TaxID=393608 RepID=A0A7C9AE60_OPUST